DCGKAFQALTEFRRGEGQALGFARVPVLLERDAHRYGLHPVLFESALQTLVVCTRPGDDGRGALEPSRIAEVRVHRPGGRLCSHARLRANRERAERLGGAVRLFDEAGRPVAEVMGLRLRRSEPAAGPTTPEDPLGHWLYEVAWPPTPRRPDLR